MFRFGPALPMNISSQRGVVPVQGMPVPDLAPKGHELYENSGSQRSQQG
jgi:hypothetical protein